MEPYIPIDKSRGLTALSGKQWGISTGAYPLGHIHWGISTGANAARTAITSLGILSPGRVVMAETFLGALLLWAYPVYL